MATPQIWRVTYPAGERSRVTNDLNTYIGTSVSGDGRSLATVQTQTISSVYVIDPKGQERKISTGPNPTDGLTGAAWLPDGRLVYTSTAGGLTQLWIADADGSRARQLTSTSGPSETPAVAPDGTWIYFASFTKEGECVFRIAADGGGLKQLTTDGDARGLLVSPDGRTLYFTALKAGTPRLMRVSSGGGTPQPVANVYFRARNLSPDGARVAGNAWSDELHRTVFAILDLAGRTMDVRPEWPTATLFAAGGGFVSVQRILGKSVIMTRPAVGGAWRPLTTGTEDFVYGAAVSTTGRLAVARGQQISDVVVMTAK
jgi:Tol biopolymer transport system component